MSQTSISGLTHFCMQACSFEFAAHLVMISSRNEQVFIF